MRRYISIKTKDMVGHTYNFLYVESVLNERGKRGEILINCICECLNQIIADGYKVRTGRTKSCGCHKLGSRTKDISGKKFGRLTVLKYVGSKYLDKRKKMKGAMWLCSCDCGNTKEIAGKNLRSGMVKTCGCRMR